MELRCPSCGKAMWAPDPRAVSVEQELAKETKSGQETFDCSTCGTAMPFPAARGDIGEATHRWLPTEPGPSPSEEASKPFPSRLAEPLPSPGYPDQIETRDRFTAEIQAQHARILAGRPVPELLSEEPTILAKRPGGFCDPLGSGERKVEPTLMEAADGATHFPPPRFGTPEDRQIKDPRNAGNEKDDRKGERR